MMMEKIKAIFRKEENRKRLKRALSCILFLCIAAYIFAKTTYLFRNSDYDRTHIIGIKEEDALDMVYIGGSAAFVYWQPLKAWNDCGFASYTYATNSMVAESIKYYMAEVLKTQDPQLFVIDIRPFQYWDAAVNEGGIRRTTDSMDISLDRLKMVNYNLSHRDTDENTDWVSYYLDIAKYHTNYEALGNPLNWEYSDNAAKCDNKGWEWMLSHAYLEKPTDFYTDERAVLEAGCEKVLYDLLDYCQEAEKEVLFVVCPYVITKEEQAKYNTLSDIIQSYGFQYLNANEYYDEMELDFTTDFYHISHVNCFGAEKYTAFLESYLDEHYDLPDHREDESYQKWDEDYIRFSEEEARAKENIHVQMAAKEESTRAGEEMRKTEDAFEWAALAQNSYFTVVAVSQGETLTSSTAFTALLKQFNITASDISNNENAVIRVLSGGTGIYTNSADGKTEYTGMAGNLSLKILAENEVSILIGDEEYSRQQDGINIVVLDNNRNIVVDSVTLSCDMDGEIGLRR